MRALVTGAAGFVGTHLVRALRAGGHMVVAGALDAPPQGEGGVRWLRVDLADPASLRAAVEEARPDCVFHLAARAAVGDAAADPLGTWEVNATGTLRLLAALPPGVRVVLAGSAQVYGIVPDAEQPIREQRPLRPLNGYAASKAAAELVVLQQTLAGAVAGVVARSFNHAGPGQDARFALPSFARQLARIARGEAEPVLRVGNLEARRDFLDVRDAVQAYLRLADAGEPGRAYNVCSGEAPPLAQLLEEMVALSGTGARIEVDPARVRPLDQPLLLGDPSALRALGWEPRVPRARMLADLLAAEGVPVASGEAVA